MKNEKVRIVRVSLMAMTIVIWVVFGLLAFRQLQLMKTADPQGDTGISFGLAALSGVVGPTVIGLTLLSVTASVWLGKRPKVPSYNQQIRSPKSADH